MAQLAFTVMMTMMTMMMSMVIVMMTMMLMLMTMMMVMVMTMTMTITLTIMMTMMMLITNMMIMHDDVHDAHLDGRVGFCTSLHASSKLDLWTGWLAIDDFVNTRYIGQRKPTYNYACDKNSLQSRISVIR